MLLADLVIRAELADYYFDSYYWLLLSVECMVASYWWPVFCATETLKFVKEVTYDCCLMAACCRTLSFSMSLFWDAVN